MQTIVLSKMEIKTLIRALDLLDDQLSYEDIQCNSDGEWVEFDAAGNLVNDSLNILYMKALGELDAKLGLADKCL